MAECPYAAGVFLSQAGVAGSQYLERGSMKKAKRLQRRGHLVKRDKTIETFLKILDAKEARFKGWKRQIIGVLEVYIHPKTRERMVSRVGRLAVFPDSDVNRAVLADPDYPYSLGY